MHGHMDIKWMNSVVCTEQILICFTGELLCYLTQLTAFYE